MALEKEECSNIKRNNDFVYSSDALVSDVRTLMYGCVLAFCMDPPESTWLDIDAALIHINQVEHFTRLNSKFNQSNHLGQDYEWARAQQLEPGLTLSQIVGNVAKRYTIWPATGEFRAVKKGKAGVR